MKCFIKTRSLTMVSLYVSFTENVSVQTSAEGAGSDSGSVLFRGKE